MADHIYDTLDDTLRYHNKYLDECNFVVYMSKDMLYRLASVAGYHHLMPSQDGAGFTFMGWEVVEVVGKYNYVHFSLLGFKS